MREAVLILVLLVGMTHTMVIGCAGNGKTEQLSKDVTRLVSKGLSVLCLSFTRNAADELTDRVILTDPVCAGHISDGSLVITTMHSWLTKLLIELADSPAVSLQTVIDEGLDFIQSRPNIIHAHRKVDVVIVDEAQDLSSQQFSVIIALSRVWRHIEYIVVGDNIQSVFAFQGARPDLMLELPKRMEAETGRGCDVVFRNINKRCSSQIIAAANANIMNSDIEEKENHLMKTPSVTSQDAISSSTSLPTLLVSENRWDAIRDIRSLVLSIISSSHEKKKQALPSIVILHRTQFGLRDIANELLKTIDVDIAFNLDSCAMRGEKSSAPVQLRTIHGCKGGTWDIVIIAGMTDVCGLPNERAVDEGEIHEERRLFHVALTRARHRCILSTNIKDGVSRFVPMEDARTCYCIQRGLNNIVSDAESLKEYFFTNSESPQSTSTEPLTTFLDLKEAIWPIETGSGWSMPVNVTNVSNRIRDCIRTRGDEKKPDMDRMNRLMREVILKVRICTHKSELAVEGLEPRHFHSATDVCALQRQSLLLVASVFISRGTVTHLPSGWLQEVMLPCVCGQSEPSTSGIHSQRRRNANLMFTTTASTGSKRSRSEDPLDQYHAAMAGHGMRETHYRPFSRDWDSYRCPLVEIRRNVMRAWGFLLETASVESHDSEKLMRAGLWACLRFNPIVAARVTAPIHSNGRVCIDSLAASMESNLNAVRRIVAASEQIVSSAVPIVHSITEGPPDTVDVLASIVTIMTNTPRDRKPVEFTLALTHPIDANPSVTMCNVTVDIQHSVREMIETIQEYAD